MTTTIVQQGENHVIV